jgi:hypothetical protein
MRESRASNGVRRLSDRRQSPCGFQALSSPGCPLPGVTCAVAAGILPAVEPGILPGGMAVPQPPSAPPGGRMPPSAAGRMPAATSPRCDPGGCRAVEPLDTLARDWQHRRQTNVGCSQPSITRAAARTHRKDLIGIPSNVRWYWYALSPSCPVALGNSPR